MVMLLHYGSVTLEPVMKLFYFSSFCFLLCFVVVTGCAPKNPDGRVDVTGTILLNGVPLNGAGGVVLDPIDGQRGDGGRSPILNGKIFFTKRSAPKPGKYTVRIYSVQDFDSVTKKSILVDGKYQVQGTTYLAKVIPDEFNVNSKIEFEVVKGRRNVFNYNIVTDYKPEPNK
ncbi:hypothetical protein FACS189454_03390 [Planctomycetales bacterium]|nr:hypothetical protein FACS189454_03390 [Planctomycetales bacterium]